MKEYYRGFDESERLTTAPNNVELLRTMDILSRHLPDIPAVILDVGGGAGIYALPLAARGYTVHLIDAVERHVDEASAASCLQVNATLASSKVGDARALDFPDNFADAVILFGPLYHLTERTDRLTALRECRRVLKPGGRLFGAAISRFASFFDGVARGFLTDPSFVEILHSDLKSGQHRNQSGNLQYFTDSFFHLPTELHREMIDAELTVEAIIGIEGPIWGLDGAPGWSTQEGRATILDLLREVEEQPALLGASAHVMGVASRK